MKLIKFSGLVLAVLIAGLYTDPASAQLKIGYINSNQILKTYKEAQDVRKQLADLNAQWEKEAKDKQTEIQNLNDQLESQSLLLSEERKAAKQKEIQDLYLKYQQYLQETWNPQGGKAVQKEVELLQPVYDKINVAIKKIAVADEFSYVFDVVAGNILYAADDQADLTERVLEELNKGLPAGKEGTK